VPRFRVWYVNLARSVSSDSLCLGTGMGFGMLGGIAVASICCFVCGNGHGSAPLCGVVENRRYKGRSERPESILQPIDGCGDPKFSISPSFVIPTIVISACLPNFRPQAVPLSPPPPPPPPSQCVRARRQELAAPIPVAPQQTSIQALPRSRYTLSAPEA
jgi:hypothetical protein